MTENVADNLPEFIEQALNEGFMHDIVMAASKCGSYDSYTEFLNILLEKTSEEQKRLDAQEERKKVTAAIVAKNIKKYEMLESFRSYAIHLVQSVYNTTAVNIDKLSTLISNCMSPDILYIYKKPLYYMACNPEAPIVAKCIKECLDEWTVNQQIITEMTAYYSSLGKEFDDTDLMIAASIQMLPRSYSVLQEDSPDTYKAYCSAFLQAKHHPYDVNAEEAEHLCKADSEQLASPIQAIGKTAGKVTSLKYAVRKGFNDAFTEELGDFAETHEDDVKKKKEIKEQKAIKREETLRREEEEEHRLSHAQRERQIKGNPHYSYDSSYNVRESSVKRNSNYPPQKNTRDFSPHIPVNILILGGNVITLLLLLLVTPGLCFFTLPGFLAASAGLLMIKADRATALPMNSKVSPVKLIAIGYIGVILGFLLYT